MIRFRLRTLMVAVAAVGMALAAYLSLVSRQARFEREASYHLNCVTGIAAIGTEGKKFRLLSVTREGRPVSPEQLRRDLWHISLCLKYRAAAQRPWWPIGIDTPAP